MSLGDGGTLLVSESVFEVLRHREAYSNKFKAYSAIVKHDVELKVYQYINKDWQGLSNYPPNTLARREHSIDATFRRCLAENRSTKRTERRCIHDAREAWTRECDRLEVGPLGFLNAEDKEHYNRILTAAKQLLADYQIFTTNLYAKRRGSMFRVLSDDKRMELEKALATELAWIMAEIEDGITEANATQQPLGEMGSNS